MMSFSFRVSLLVFDWMTSLLVRVKYWSHPLLMCWVMLSVTCLSTKLDGTFLDCYLCTLCTSWTTLFFKTPLWSTIWPVQTSEYNTRICCSIFTTHFYFCFLCADLAPLSKYSILSLASIPMLKASSVCHEIQGKFWDSLSPILFRLKSKHICMLTMSLLSESYHTMNSFLCSPLL